MVPQVLLDAIPELKARRNPVALPGVKQNKMKNIFTHGDLLIQKQLKNSLSCKNAFLKELLNIFRVQTSEKIFLGLSRLRTEQ